MAITDWPADERPRKRLMQKGVEVLSDTEQLVIFLRVGVAGKSAVDLARHLLSNFGSLNGIFPAAPPRLKLCMECVLASIANYKPFLK